MCLEKIPVLGYYYLLCLILKFVDFVDQWQFLPVLVWHQLSLMPISDPMYQTNSGFFFTSLIRVLRVVSSLL